MSVDYPRISKEILPSKEGQSQSDSIPSVSNHCQVAVGLGVSNLRDRVHQPDRRPLTPFRNIRPGHSDGLYHTLWCIGQILHLHLTLCPGEHREWAIQTIR